VSDDTGATDLVDAQYFLFNLLALAFFLGTFAFNLNEGFPDLPLLLAGLTSVSAGAYVAKKVTERGVPALKSVSPPRAPRGTKVELAGQNLILLSAPEGARLPTIHVGKRKAKVEPAQKQQSKTGLDRLTVTIPRDAPFGDAPIVAEVAGNRTEELSFEVAHIIEIETVHPRRFPAATEGPIVVTGKNLDKVTSAQLGGAPVHIETDRKPTRLTLRLRSGEIYQTGEEIALTLLTESEESEPEQVYVEG
jgi:hypothetical protein